MNPIVQNTNPIIKRRMGLAQCILGIIIIGIAADFTLVAKDNHDYLLIFIYTIIGSPLAVTLFNCGIKNISFYRDFSDTKDKLDHLSVNILASTNGLIFPGSLDIATIRYLAGLKLIKAIIFPETLDHGYSISCFGRYLLESELRYKKLYLSIFCDMFLIRFLQGDQYRKEFTQEKNRFKKEYLISWEKSQKIFQTILQERQILGSDIVQMFNNYKQRKDFNIIMEEIINPWKRRVDNERKLKSFKLYLSMKILPFQTIP